MTVFVDLVCGATDDVLLSSNECVCNKSVAVDNLCVDVDIDALAVVFSVPFSGTLVSFTITRLKSVVLKVGLLVVSDIKVH